MITIGDAPVRVALLGSGVVGSQVARILVEQADDLRERVGRPLELVGIGVRTPGERPGIDSALLTTDVDALVRRCQGFYGDHLDCPPFRLALGSKAYRSINEALNSRLQVLEDTRALALSVDKDA